MGRDWSPQPPPSHVTVNLGVSREPTHRVYTQTLSGLQPGGIFWYRVKLGQRDVFRNQGKALKAPGQAQRLVIAGDLVTDASASQANAKRMADRLLAEDPDLMIVPGDIVNMAGHAWQYRDLLFSIYNNSEHGAAFGAPLMRSLPMVTCLGNNDTDQVGQVWEGMRVTSPQPNGLAYYYYFAQLLNGPILDLNSSPSGSKPEALSPWLQPSGLFDPFLAAAGDRYLRMGNYSFDSGDIHWVMLDSCLYMDYWQDDRLRNWLAADLKASAANWKFVVFHHPVFSHHGGTRKYDEKWMRALWPILEAGKVDMTFSGHLHSYQRALPIHFTPFTGPRWLEQTHFNDDAHIIQDTAFTGVSPRTTAQGIIPIITGAGGATFHAYEDPPTAPPRPLRPVAFIKERLAYSLLEVDPTQVKFKQMVLNPGTRAWEVGDQFLLTK